MNKLNTGIRLKEIMGRKGLNQTDILKLCEPYCKKYNVKINKSHLSQYISGKNEPRQDKLSILSLALNVSEAWLMGYDVPMEKEIDWNDFNDLENKMQQQLPILEDLSKVFGKDFYKLVILYDMLNIDGKQKVQDYIIDICENNKYIKDGYEEQDVYQAISIEL